MSDTNNRVVWVQTKKKWKGAGDQGRVCRWDSGSYVQGIKRLIWFLKVMPLLKQVTHLLMT